MNPSSLHQVVSRRQSRQAGFTLVEIMVGLAIGMLAGLVIMQVFATFESQKRATTGASDALTNGNIALFKVARDVQNSGYSLVPRSKTASPLMCPLPLYIDPILKPQVTDIFPVTIIDNYLGSGSDALTLRYGDTLRGGTSTDIGNVVVNDAVVNSYFGCVKGDVTLVIDPTGSNCAVSKANAVQLAPSSPPVYPATLSPGPVTLNDVKYAASGGTLACLGNWHEVTYTIDTNKFNLQRQDLGLVGASGVEPSVAGIVNMQAQYGISALSSSNQVVAWVNPVDGQASGNWGPGISRDERNRIKAIHIAIVARDAKMEPDVVTNACTTPLGTVNNGPCAWNDAVLTDAAPAINLNAIVPNWQQYRYRVFETILPIRNVVFSQPILVP